MYPIQNKLFHFITLLCFALFLKIICIDHLQGILINTESLASYNFVQGWLIAITNLLFYFFYYILIVVVINLITIFILKKQEITPLEFIDFRKKIIPYYIDIISQKLKNKIPISIFLIKTLIICFILFLLIIITNYKVTVILWFFLQLIIPKIISIYSRIKYFPLFIINFFCFGLSLVSWILLTSTYNENFISVIGGMAGIKSLLLYYNEYYIIWGVGFGFISLAIFILYYLIALKINPITTKLTQQVSSKRKYLYIIILLIPTLFFSITTQISQKSIFEQIIAKDKYPSLLKPFQRNKWLTEQVESSSSHTNTIVYLKEKTIISIQNKIDYYFYKRATSRYIQDVSSIIGQDPTSDFLVVPHHSIHKLEKFATNLPLPDSTLELTLSKNEWESFQLIIIPNRLINLSDVQVTLVSESLNLETVDFFQNEYIKLLKPNYTPAHKGFISDPLIPMKIKSTKSVNKIIAKNNFPFTIKSGECSSVWCSLKTSKKSKVGNHTLYLKVKSKTSDDNQWKEKNIKLKLRILDYTLPTKMTLKTAFPTTPNYLNYYKDTPSKDAYDLYANYNQKYHLSPCEIYKPIGTNIPIHLWPKFIEKGANSICLGSIGYYHKDSIAQRNSYKKLLRMKIDSLKRYNIYEYAFLYGPDEITQKDYPLLQEMIKLVREVDKKIPISCTTILPNRELEKMVDIYIPNLENIKKTKPLPDKANTWWYVCANPKSNLQPNFFTDYTAISPRILFWKANSCNAKGLLYYSTVFWINNTYFPTIYDDFRNMVWNSNPNENNLKNGKRWPNIPWISYSYQKNNGDGQLFYPGTKPNELWPSIRLINIRDGIEDYEYAHQIRNMSISKISRQLKSERKKWLNQFRRVTKMKKLNELEPSILLKLKSSGGHILEEYSKEIKH